MSKNAILEGKTRRPQNDLTGTANPRPSAAEEARPLRSVNEILDETLAQREGVFDDEETNPGLGGTGRLSPAPGDEDASAADPRSSAFRTEDSASSNQENDDDAESGDSPAARRDEGNHGSEVEDRAR